MNISYSLKILFSPLIFLMSLFISGYTSAEISVIVHSSNEVNLSAKNIQRIFLGKKKEFSAGKRALPIHLPIGNDVAERFNAKVLKKEGQKLSGYWGQYIFTGKGLPPEQVESMMEVINLVTTNPNAIGYVDSKVVDDTVRVLYKF